MQAIVKTTTQIYEQRQRIYNLQQEVLTAQIFKANPETGGNQMLAHNWGNERARQLISQSQDRNSLIYRLFEKYYHEAFKREYPTHLKSRR